MMAMQGPVRSSVRAACSIECALTIAVWLGFARCANGLSSAI